MSFSPILIPCSPSTEGEIRVYENGGTAAILAPFFPYSYTYSYTHIS